MQSQYVPIREGTDKIPLRDIDLYSKVDYFQSLVPGVVVMAIFLGTLTTGAFNLVMDRFLGIEESYLLTPLSKSHIVSGLIVSGLIGKWPFDNHGYCCVNINSEHADNRHSLLWRIGTVFIASYCHCSYNSCSAQLHVCHPWKD